MDVLLNTRVGTRYYNIWFILIFISHNNKINWYVSRMLTAYVNHNNIAYYNIFGLSAGIRRIGT